MKSILYFALVSLAAAEVYETGDPCGADDECQDMYENAYCNTNMMECYKYSCDEDN